MMPAPDDGSTSKVCPFCLAANRLERETCARCGHSLANANMARDR